MADNKKVNSGALWYVPLGVTTAVGVVVGRRYKTDAAGLVTFTLPATASTGNQFGVTGYGSGGWQIAQNANQVIRDSAGATSVGVAGHLDSASRYDSVLLECAVAGASTEWIIISGRGSPTMT